MRARQGSWAAGCFAGGVGNLRGTPVSVPLLKRCTEQPHTRPRLRSTCVASSRRRRLLSYVLSVPQRMDRYLEARWWRKYSWAGISMGTGFYAGNIVTLSFGALAVNDVLAAAITLVFCEAVTVLYYTAREPTISLWFLNCFKIGLIASLLADAAKLGS